eukprot:CAMPEP_0197863824 /NCGR_PEP_ID=MMETSP1438-20131217/41563_1 /TAXON_ID=1461541 /ORGANISM="Pterosperma sp., Strain CCMP1384" /LENGTH=91 /DNA_ID=CAMNT_0043481861 /DNA_START=134 /DNA_END=406 /DNA_ORIENTATION=+
MDKGAPAFAAPRYATQPRNPSLAPTDFLPTISAPQRPMSICGPYKKNPIIKTENACKYGAPAGTALNAINAPMTPTKYTITTCTLFPTAPP